MQLVTSNIRQPEDVIASRTDHNYSGQSSQIGSAKSAPSELELIKRGQRWTYEEEQLLLNLRDQEMPWEEISTFFPERTLVALKMKHFQVKQSQSTAADKHGKAKPWTDEENELLLALKKVHTPWADIARILPERSLQSIRSNYDSLIKNPPLSIPQRAVPHYTAEDDELLLKLAREGLPWKQRQAYFENRSLQSLKSRYQLLKRKQGKSSPRTSPKSFTPEEDEFIIQAVEWGTKTSDIARLLGRNKTSIRGRIKRLKKSNQLDPARRKGRGSSYTAAEFELIRTLVDEGMSFEDIATTHFPARSAMGIRLAFEKCTER